MRVRARAVLAALALAAGVLAGPVAAQALPTQPVQATEDEPEWAPVSEATIRPGVRVTSQSGSCTSNFIFYERHEDAAGVVTFDVYIGLAAHCFTLGGSTGTNGCTTPTRELGSAAAVAGAQHPGTLAYSSWVTVKAVEETDGDICGTNDFALVKLDPRDHGRVNPTLQYFGGPTGLRTATTGLGDVLYSYGNSSLRQDIAALSPKRGWSTGTSNAGWSHRVYTVTPGIPGDSGSGFLDDEGRAMGVVVTLQAAPYPASNGVTDLAKALAYANGKTALNVLLAPGTEDFFDPVLP